MPWPLNLVNIIIAHVSFCFPFVAVVVRSRLVGFNRQLEEASKDLGASEWQTFWSIIVPFMKPGLIAGALLAFTLSLDDFVITFFTSGPETVTFPVKVYSLVRRGVSPEINAASTVLIVITVIATVLAMKLQAPAKVGQGLNHDRTHRLHPQCDQEVSRRRHRRRQCLLRHRPERVLRAAGAVGLRQDHAAPHDLRPRDADLRARSSSAARTWR